MHFHYAHDISKFFPALILTHLQTMKMPGRHRFENRL